MNPSQRNPFPQKRESVRIDHETGLIHGLPEGPQPLVGPTTGRAYEDLKKNEKNHQAAMRLMKGRMLSNWKCIQCKRVWKGSLIRLCFKTIDGKKYEEFRCPDPKCQAPVILHESVADIAVRQAEEQRMGRA